ncbi:phosphoribosylglycinamide formyltransferase [Crocinitomix catalasitica]|uniref:phosphoribosylglycinamide formyltransferase n=1 Tax=Crocinitomix catalasitica TaxID=184607 RepID=UPI0004809651|nr:phosphoribosylglycinamide formyltransferase [Crocinitomix catalasitica]
MKTNIAIFASGGGSNAEQIIRHFHNHESIQIALVVSNNENAYVLERATNHDIPFYVHATGDMEGELMMSILKVYKIDFIVLAGYLKKITPNLINAFPNKIVNIHPALLPKYGGKGMYGMNVHRAVAEAKERESGITIHFVNENYDEGSIIKQYTCELNLSDSAEDIQRKVLSLEHQYFASSIETLIEQNQ